MASEGSILQTDSSSIGAVVTSETLISLPLVKRNCTEVMDLSPGVSQDVNNALVLGRGTGSVIPGGISAMGSRPGLASPWLLAVKWRERPWRLLEAMPSHN